MFTGIVERTVRVIGASKGPNFTRLVLPDPWGDVRGGESVAVNGVCLTVAEQAPGELMFDVVRETLAKTNLGLLNGGDEAHVERSLRAGDRFDGHFVQGHVDGTAKLVSLVTNQAEWRLAGECPAPLAKYVVPKGSICLDGVSLTVATVEGTRFEVALIPTTIRVTALGRRPTGWPLNLECDILTKAVVETVERLRG